MNLYLHSYLVEENVEEIDNIFQYCFDHEESSIQGNNLFSLNCELKLFQEISRVCDVT